MQRLNHFHVSVDQVRLLDPRVSRVPVQIRMVTWLHDHQLGLQGNNLPKRAGILVRTFEQRTVGCDRRRRWDGHPLRTMALASQPRRNPMAAGGSLYCPACEAPTSTTGPAGQGNVFGGDGRISH